MTVIIGKPVSEIVLGIMQLEDGSIMPYVYSQSEAIKEKIGIRTDVIKVTNVNGINMLCEIDDQAGRLPSEILLKNMVIFPQCPEQMIRLIAQRSDFTKEELRIAESLTQTNSVED